jgi:hypothetical protein
MRDKLFERWRRVGQFHVSNYGRIKKGNRIMRQQCWGRVACCKVNGRTCSVPRLVARAWLGLKENDRRRVRRKRGRSNAAANLYLTQLRGEECDRHKLTDSQVLAIYKSDDPQAALAIENGVSKSCISKIQTGRNWAWLTEPAATK